MGEGLSVSYPRIEPSLRRVRWTARCRFSKAFSILPSDRTIATLRDNVSLVQETNFQYPTLGSNHRYAPTRTRRRCRTRALSVSYPRIEPSLPPGHAPRRPTVRGFQYPTLGSNHRYRAGALSIARDHPGLSVSYPRIEPSLRLRQRRHRRAPRTFSILPSDRTIATRSAPR